MRCIGSDTRISESKIFLRQIPHERSLPEGWEKKIMSIAEEYEIIVQRLEFERKKHLDELPDYWETSPAIKAEIALFTRNLQETVAFLDNDCTADQLSWMSEVYEEISAKLQSWEFIDALKRAADRFPEECKIYNIRECILFAEGQLNDEVYRQRYPDFGK